jgi:acyl-CoA thioester hydrolase
MALVYQRRFRIRQYECDAYGHLNNVNYLRFMQESAIEASAAVGYDIARYNAIGHHWLVHETELEFLRPVEYGDTLEVKTWVIDFRRVRSRRAYELYSVSTGELAARGQTDWVYLDTATGLPAPIPAEMVAAFLPEGQGAPSRPSRREHYPPPPPGVFKLRRRVTFQDLDAVGHVNNAVYLAYVEDCGFQVGAAFGWPASRLWAEGFAIWPRRHRIRYHAPAQLDDEIETATWLSDWRRATALRHYTVSRVADEMLLAEVHTLYAWVERASGRPARFPPILVADFAANTAQLSPEGRQAP